MAELISVDEREGDLVERTPLLATHVVLVSDAQAGALLQVGVWVRVSLQQQVLYLVLLGLLSLKITDFSVSVFVFHQATQYCTY